jgi:hypothetical protein
MSLRHGFKAEANRISLRLRVGLGLASHAPIDLKRAAGLFGALVVSLEDLRDAAEDAVRHLTEVEPGAFSAVTIPLSDTERVIIYNHTHSPGRQNSNIAHEIAHLALGHEFTLPIDTTGSRIIDRDIEEEANWLGPTILISNEAALHILREEIDALTACGLYGVSAEVLRMRINASGARIRLRRSHTSPLARTYAPRSRRSRS